MTIMMKQYVVSSFLATMTSLKLAENTIAAASKGISWLYLIIALQAIIAILMVKWSVDLLKWTMQAECVIERLQLELNKKQ